MGLFSSLFGKKPEPEAPQVNEEEAPGVPFEELAAALHSPEGALRVDAARALLERWRGGDPQAAEIVAPQLSHLLEDPEPLVRVVGLQGVRLLRKPENVEKNAGGVLALLADPVAQVRTAAVWSAVRLPGEAARQQVRALLTSAEEPMRFAAACALSDVRDGAALPELCAALREDHRRQEALSALMSLGDAGALPEIAKLFEDESLGEFDRTLVAAAMARFGDARGGAHLVERIEQDADDRPVAAEWAGRLGVEAAAPALGELADAEGDPAQGAAMRALGRLHAPGAEERLLRVAGSDDAPDDLRMDAAEGLAELGTPAALELLQKLAAGEPPELAQLCRELLVEVEAAAR
jgi:HEAT repeat protein